MRKLLLVLLLIISVTLLMSAKKLEVFLQAHYDPTQYPETSKMVEDIAKEYMKMHPDVEIELIPAEAGGAGAGGAETTYRAWLTARMGAGNPPHIAWEHFYMRWSEKGWWVALDDYLDKPNPYYPGKTWRECIYDFVWNNVVAPDGHYYTVALDWVETGFYYNKDIFDKLGLSPHWNTWEEFLETLKKIKKAGYIPLVASEWAFFQWADDILMTAFWADKVPEMYMEEKYKYEQYYKGKPWRMLTAEEIARAIYKEIYSAYDERFEAFLKAMKEWSQYWVPGFSTLSSEEALSIFLSGRAALLWDGSWARPDIANSAGFKWGITYLPPITVAKKYLPKELQDVSFRVGGPSSAAQYGITVRAQKEDLVKEAVDFLMYLSTPDTLGKVIAAEGRFVPMIVGTKVSEDVKFFAENVASLPTRAFTDPAGRLTPEAGEKYKKVMQEYLLGQIDIKTAQEKFQQIFEEALKDLAQENKYDWYK